MVILPNFEIFGRYLFEERDLDRSSSTTYRAHHRRIYDYFSDRNYTKDNIVLFLEALRREGLNPATINNYLKMFRHLDRFLKVSESADIKRRKVDVRKYKTITEEQFEKIVSTHPKRWNCQESDDYRFDTAFRLCYILGLRTRELINLRWEHVFPESILITNTKTNVDRSLPIEQPTFEMLCKLQRHTHGFVFGNRFGRMKRGTINKELKRRLEMLGWMNILDRFYDLRHSTATNLDDKEISPFLIRDYMGHKNISSTMVYVHSNPKRLRKVSRRAPLSDQFMEFDVGKNMIRDFAIASFSKTKFLVSMADIKDGHFRLEFIDPSKQEHTE